MAQGTATRRRDARQVFGQLFKLERERRGLTQAAVVERLDALADATESGRGGRRRAVAAPWAGRSACWVSRVESGDVAKLDRGIVVALCRALGCDRQGRVALLLAAGLSPYPIPVCVSWEELLRWYGRAAELLPEASYVTESADRRGGRVATPAK